jgi:serine/threonine protein kinase
MSPEQLRGERLNYLSDIFSTGTVLFEMVSEENPFSRKSEAETISAILAGTPSESEHLSGTKESLDRIARKCLDKNKENRYQSATELLIALQAPEERPSPRSFPVGLRSIAIAAVILLVLVGAFITYILQPAVPTLAILPFSNQTGDGNNDYISSGIGTSFIDRLSFASGVHVLKHRSIRIRES